MKSFIVDDKGCLCRYNNRKKKRLRFNGDVGSRNECFGVTQRRQRFAAPVAYFGNIFTDAGRKTFKVTTGQLPVLSGRRTTPMDPTERG